MIQSRVQTSTLTMRQALLGGKLYGPFDRDAGDTFIFIHPTVAVQQFILLGLVGLEVRHRINLQHRLFETAGIHRESGHMTGPELPIQSRKKGHQSHHKKQEEQQEGTSKAPRFVAGMGSRIS